jgi:hypothetical protein
VFLTSKQKYSRSNRNIKIQEAVLDMELEVQDVVLVNHVQDVKKEMLCKTTFKLGNVAMSPDSLL